MYVLILLLVPFLFLFHTYLAMAGLVVAIVLMYSQRTRRTKRPKREPEPMYTAGYEN